ncbi:MAG: hypothetical protein ACRDIY_14585 [Chloroflexota bacterium]
MSRQFATSRARFTKYLGATVASTFFSLGPRPIRAAPFETPGLLPATTFIHYYPWYAGTPSYRHWNGGDPNRDDPWDNLAAASYPALGPYDSMDPLGTIDQHLAWLKSAGIDVLILSWWGQGSYEDVAAGAVMSRVAARGLKACFQIEPYAGRTPWSTVDDIASLYARYGTDPAFFRVVRPTINGPSRQPRGLFFVYEPSGQGWSSAIGSLRGTSADAIILVRTDDSKLFADADVRGQIGWTGADGLYNYGYYDASTTYNVALPRSPDYLLIFAACPGFDNSRVSGVTNPTIVPRSSGHSYDASWSWLAVQKPEGVAVVSFNEWHEGTQIEPATPHQCAGYTYLDYTGDYGLTGQAAATAYLSRTTYWSGRYKGATTSSISRRVYLPEISVG